MSTPRSNSRFVQLICCTVLMALAIASQAQAVVYDATWNGGDGYWSTGGMWSGSVVPNNGSDSYNVFIDGGNTGTNSNVSLDTSATIDTLSMDEGDSLNVGDGCTLSVVRSSITNNGTIGFTTYWYNSTLQISGPTMLTGTGTVHMSIPYCSAVITGAISTDVLTNDLGHTISGAGLLGNGNMGLVNKGLIDANASGQALTVQPSSAGVTNEGTMQASNGGTLALTGGTFTNTDGLIQALDSSTVQLLNGAVIANGTLSSTGTGVFDIPDGQTATLQGNITNNGTIGFTAGWYNSTLQISGPTTLTGTGTVHMSIPYCSAVITGATSTDVLTNDLGHTISGAGLLGNGNMGLVNKGLVDANASGQALTVQPSSAGVTNEGTMQASNGGTLALTGGTFTNTDGLIQALDDSVLQLTDTTFTNTNGVIQALDNSVMQLTGTMFANTNGVIQASDNSLMQLTGGTFTNTNGLIQALDSSVVQLQNSATIVGGTLTNAGTGYFQISGGQMATLADTTVNNGSLAIQGSDCVGGGACLQIGGATTLTGNSRVSMRNGMSYSWGWQYAVIQGMAAGDILTNDTGCTISGQGLLGNGAMGIINKGLIDANLASSGLTVQPSSAGVMNQGTMQASDGGSLILSGGTFTNTDGVIQALDSSVVQLQNNATIIGGTLNSTGTGFIQVAGGQTATLTGMITNNGSLAIQGSDCVGGGACLQISDATTLTGNSRVSMRNGMSYSWGWQHAVIQGMAAGDILTNDTGCTISGQGLLGNGAMGIINKGLIDANLASSGLTVQPSSAGVMNQGTMQASDGGSLQLTGGVFANTGTIAALNASSVAFASDATVSDINSSGSLTAGTWKAVDTGAGATIAVASAASTINTIGSDATIELSGANSAFTVNGTAIDSTLTTNQGTLKLSDGRALTTSDSFTNEGAISLGEAVRMGIEGDYTQLTTGLVEFDIFGIGGTGHDFGQLDVLEDASLSGGIMVQFQRYSPTIGDSWKLITTEGMLTTSGLTTSIMGLASGVHFAEVFDDHFYELTITAVPEPSVIVLLLTLGGVGVLGYLRRRRA